MLFARDGSHGVVGAPSLDEVSEEVVRRISEVVSASAAGAPDTRVGGVADLHKQHDRLRLPHVELQTDVASTHSPLSLQWEADCATSRRVRGNLISATSIP